MDNLSVGNSVNKLTVKLFVDKNLRVTWPPIYSLLKFIGNDILPIDTYSFVIPKILVVKNEESCQHPISSEQIKLKKSNNNKNKKKTHLINLKFFEFFFVIS